MQRLTDKFVSNIKPAAPGKRADYWDALVPGFGLRVTDRGAKSFVVYVRWPGTGSPARRALGSFPLLALADARTKARAWLDLVARGIDPKTQEQDRVLAEQRRTRTTFASVAEAWFADELKGQRKAAEVERDVRREFVAEWGGRPITDITTLDVRNLIKAKAQAAPAQARNLLGYIKRLFEWAVEQHAYGLAVSPAAALRPSKIVGKKVVRQRVLDDGELRALWRAAEGMGYPYGQVFQLLALTGQRKSEVAEARWREFDLQKGLWTIPAERMKMDGAHLVPLSDDAIAILEKLPRFKRGDHLFSTTFGEKPVNGFSKSKVRLDKAMQAKEPFVIHDIRRTMRTQLSAIPGISDRTRELVIAHAQPGLHKIYDQYSYLNEKRQALDLWAARLRSIVDPAPAAANVVPLRGKGSPV